jgi:hypothetical protein
MNRGVRDDNGRCNHGNGYEMRDGYSSQDCNALTHLRWTARFWFDTRRAILVMRFASVFVEDTRS